MTRNQHPSTSPLVGVDVGSAIQARLLSSLRDILRSFGYDKCFHIAYSGGLDSSVLLALCHALRHQIPLKLRAMHVNHRLSANADAWAQHCRDTCKQYEIEYSETTLQIDLCAGDSLEEVAREKRYEIFSAGLNNGDVLLTAHQQDDQAETLLLQLLRGAGLKGLAAMPMAKACGGGVHLRPLLNFTRAELQQYAQEQRLNWIDDESNRNTKLTRNFIRHDIMPLLQSRWPSISAAVARSARHCAEAQSLLDEFALQQFQGVKGRVAGTLSVSKLTRLDTARQRLLLRTWIQEQGFALPDERKIATICHDVFTAAPDRMPCVTWSGALVRRFQDDLYLLAPMVPHDIGMSVSWDFAAPLELPGVGTLTAHHTQGRGLCMGIGEVRVCFRQGGESVDLLGRGHHTLKNLFQEWGVPPWERDRIPLLYVGEELVGVIGYYLNENFTAKAGETSRAVVFTSGSPLPLAGEGSGVRVRRICT